VIGRKASEERNDLTTEIEALRDELRTTTTKLHERLARLPIVKTWTPGAVAYCGDVVAHDGGVWQAKQDTGQTPGDDDWILLVPRARDGIDGSTPRFRGRLDARKTYAALDVIESDGASYIARHDNPGIPAIDDGWQLLTKGSRGPAGETGPQGERGARGPRGEAAPSIVSWVLDTKNYRAIPTLSNGTQVAVLELRGLFEQYLIETSGAAE
jgi:hypothetical protein